MLKKDQILYVLTVFSFSSINFLNVTYSFVKRFIQEEFQMTTTQIGTADALKFLGSILGLIFYISLNMTLKPNISLLYSLSIAINGFSMGIIPLSSILSYNHKWVVFSFNFLAGMAKAPSWPLLLQLVKETIFISKSPVYQHQEDNKQFQRGKSQFQNSDQQKEKKQKTKKIIIWTSLTLIGNIFGLIVSQNLIYKVQLAWNFCLLIPVGCIFTSSILLSLYFHFSYKPQMEESISKQQSSQQEKVYLLDVKQMVLGCFRLLFLTKNCIFTWSLVLLLSIHSIMMMFLPLFLFKIGYHEYEGYILAWYNIWVILGTFGFTCINFDKIFNYQFLIVPTNQAQLCFQQEANSKVEQNLQSSQILKNNPSSLQKLNLISIFLLVGTCILLISLPCPYSCSEQNMQGEINPEKMDHNYKVLWYFAVLGLFGLFLGGPLNKYESSELLLVLKLFEEKLDLSCKRSSIRQELHRKTSKTESIQKKSKTFIGIIQLVSYFTVMYFLVLTGHIIETNILAFFFLISILSAFLLILNIIKIFQEKLSS